MAEIWRAVPDWEGLYEVSSFGRVRSLPRVRARLNGRALQTVRRKGRILNPSKCEGYPKVQLRDQGRCQREYVHRLVAKVFHGPQPEGCEVAHRDGDRSNSRADNVRWLSRLENVREKELHGTQPKGEEIWGAKLTEEAVRQIRLSNESLRVWAVRLGVTIMTISAVRNYRTWRHVGAA